MDNSKITDQLDNLKKQRLPKRPLLFTLISAIVIIGVAGGISWYYLAHPLQTPQIKKHPIHPLIEVQRAVPTSAPYNFYAMGEVEADKFIELKPKVTGPLLSVNPQFTPGGFLQQGEIAAAIDAEDYQLALDRIQGEEAQAEAQLSLEIGKGMVAQKEFELLGQEVSPQEKALMLRTPQKNAAKAVLQSVRAKKRLAEEDLAHTEIHTPFTAFVLNKSADIGSRVTPAAAIGTLVGAESFRIRLAIPQQQLHWIRTTESNPSTVRIIIGKKERYGTITHISSELEKGSRLALVYAKVDDPLSLKPENRDKPQLLLGSMVRVEIIGAQLDNIIVLERNQMVGENSVFILDENAHPTLRRVTIAARSKDRVFISEGIENGEFIVVAGLASLKENTQ